ncbi:MAG: amidohydrolase family protein [Nanoarchaeota archaeon]|nr:amidohydrolase family protein [Nanoarchaeota archaeon]
MVIEKQNIKPYVFDTLTHFMTEHTVDLKKPLGIAGYMSFVDTWSNPNIRAINLMSGACPKYQRGNKKIIPCKWEIRDGRLEEFAYEIEGDKVIEKPVETDCYHEVDEIVQQKLKAVSKEHPELKLFYSSMVHPKRTRVEDLERLIEETGENLLGIKVHGVLTASGPDDFNPELARAIAKSRIPLLIHTDYDSRDVPTEIKSMNDARIYVQRLNNSRDWVNFCLKYGIRAALQHGARNDKEVYRIVKSNSDQFIVGLGPVIEGQGPRMVEKTDDYVKAVFENLGPEHVVFNTDYPHNDPGEDLTRDIEKLLSSSEQEKVYHQNAEKFFGVSI